MAAATVSAELPDLTTPFRRKDKVVAAEAMPGIPEGTRGKVIFVAGFDWVRYWVRFENGVERGSLNRSKLVRPGEPFGAELAALREAAAVPVETAASGDGEGAAADSGAGGVVVAGVNIPSHLLDRSKKRREVLGA